MASKGSITAVHFSLVLFVMASMICGVMAYLNFDDLQKARAAEAAAKDKYKTARIARLEQQEHVQAVMEKIGHVYEDVGIDDDGSDADAPRTVIGQSRRDLKKHGNDLAARWVKPRTKDDNLEDVQLPDAEYSPTIARLYREIKDLERQFNQQQATLNSKQLAYQAIAADKQKLIDAANANRLAAEKAIQALITDTDEVLKAKNEQIKTLQGQIDKTRDDIEEAKVTLANEVKANEQRIVNLRETNAQLKVKIASSMDISFEKPDGIIRWVDRIDDLVWINVGEADKLPTRLHFFVYAKAAPGVRRAEKDLKGSIEVTRIHGQHLAQARILDFDMHEPIAKGDFIYTPLWSPGRIEKFALAGLIDIDRDGRSDRQQLHDLIAERSWSVLTEINDQGQRVGEPIDVDTKFLVIGGSPIPAEDAGDEEKKIAEAIARERKNMSDKAREHGVRIVSLNDFLAYLDYKPQRQLPTPGEGSGPESKPEAKDGGDGASTEKAPGAGGGIKRFGRQRPSGRTVKTFRSSRGN